MMPPMGANSDEWIASVLSYIRYDLAYQGNNPPRNNPETMERIMVKPEEVKKIRNQTVGRDRVWTWEELSKATQ